MSTIVGEVEVSGCPWCGWSSQIDPDGSHGEWWAVCMRTECSATGPIRSTPEEAAAAWNELSITSLAALQFEVTAWADKTFPGSTPAAKLAHLRQEVEELAKSPGDGQEMADIGLILCHIAGAAGVDLLAKMRAKHRINLGRKWGAPDAEGVVRHIEEAS